MSNERLSKIISGWLPIVVAMGQLTASLPARAEIPKLPSPLELPAPRMKWVEWKVFDKAFTQRLANPKMTDNQKVIYMKSATTAILRSGRVLAPLQLVRLLRSVRDEEMRVKALEHLAGATRYQTADIPTITVAFANEELKTDAHSLLVGIGGYGGY